jgi:hypothetical protein
MACQVEGALPEDLYERAGLHGVDPPRPRLHGKQGEDPRTGPYVHH